MATTASRSVLLGFSTTGDGVNYQQQFNAADYSPSVADNKAVVLASGNNAIIIPVGAVAITIIPPSDNTIILTLKGVNGDTGILLSLTDPTSIGLDGSGTDLVINASAEVTVRIIIS